MPPIIIWSPPIVGVPGFGQGSDGSVPSQTWSPVIVTLLNIDPSDCTQYSYCVVQHPVGVQYFGNQSNASGCPGADKPTVQTILQLASK
jgi:hypothetical protein